MTRTRYPLALVLMAVCIVTAGCGGSPAAVVRTAPAYSGDGTESGIGPSVGADLDPTAGLVGVNSEELSEAPGIDSPLAEASSEAVAAAEALLEGFLGAMADNNFDRAATLTTGEAKAFLFHLAAARRCGFALAGADLVSVTPAPELAGVGQLAIPVEATFTLDTGVTRNLTAIGVRREAEGVWLISDLLVDGSSADELSVELDSTIKADLRLTPLELCAGPNLVEGRFEVFNEGRDPIVVTEFYYLDNNGNRYAVTGTDPVTAGPIPGRNDDPLVWEWTVEVENGYDGGQFVLVAADLDESRQEDTEVLVSRDYPVLPSPFFSDFDADAAAIVKALGGVVTTTTAATTAPDSGSAPTSGTRPPSSSSTSTSTTTTVTTAATASTATTAVPTTDPPVTSSP